MKPAKSRENKKVFVGGLPSDYSELELRTHFEQFGKVDDIEWPFDKQTKTRRNFAFIVFEEEESADKASAQTKQSFGSRDCDVKKAVPQGKRFGGVNGRMAGGRGMYGAGRGGNNNSGWYAGWGQIGAMPYGAGAGWGDWYGNNGYYGQQGHHNNSGSSQGYQSGYQSKSMVIQIFTSSSGFSGGNQSGFEFPQGAQGVGRQTGAGNQQRYQQAQAQQF